MGGYVFHLNNLKVLGHKLNHARLALITKAINRNTKIQECDFTYKQFQAEQEKQEAMKTMNIITELKERNLQLYEECVVAINNYKAEESALIAVIEQLSKLEIILEAVEPSLLQTREVFGLHILSIVTPGLAFHERKYAPQLKEIVQALVDSNDWWSLGEFAGFREILVKKKEEITQEQEKIEKGNEEIHNIKVEESNRKGKMQCEWLNTGKLE